VFRYYTSYMNELHQAIGRKLHEFVNKIIFFEKKNTFKYEGVSLYPSEIHLILIVDRKPKNASQMAKMLQVTRGAISQTITRLVKKGVMLKEMDPFNKNELTLSFTPKGERILQQCRKRKKGTEKKFKEHIASYKKHEQEIIVRFLTHISKLFDKVG